jgi:catechol 2,3-dioxygenase-like lactoylglutathione lyase family enzyme
VILGVDHVALSCTSIVAATSELEKTGYAVKFVEHDVPNHGSKRALLGAFAASHAIAYAQMERGTAIELTCHGTALVPGPSPYQVLLAAPVPHATPVESEWGAFWAAALSCRRPEAILWGPLQAELWYDAADRATSPAIRAILLPVRDAELSARFWTSGLGCTEVASGSAGERKWRHVRFRTPVASWALDVVLAEGAPLRATLDAAGFPCLAVLTSNISRDADRLLEAGAHEPTGTFSVVVGGKPLQVALFRGPDDELIELVEIQKGRS